MPEFVVRFYALEGTHVEGPIPLPGDFLVDYDPEANDGRGSAVWSHDRREAKRFDSAPDAMLYWRQQSRTRPLREDGKPNRPLTACTIAVERADSVS
jgi:hypothetical protein